MSEISSKSEQVFSFEKHLKKSEALAVWLYNFLIEKEQIHRSVTSPSTKHKREKVLNLIEGFKGERHRHFQSPIWREAEALWRSSTLDDEDIGWIAKLSPGELFALWFYLRGAVVVKNQGPNSNASPYELELPDSFKNRFLEDTLEGEPNRYESLGLELIPDSTESMLSCVHDFVSYWSDSVTTKKLLLRTLKENMDGARELDYFKGLKVYSEDDANIMWRYLRDHKNMIGAKCESMASFGISRVIGVFSIWQASREYKESALKATKRNLRERQGASKEDKERANLVLDGETHAMLVELAGGPRKLSAYVTRLVWEKADSLTK
ncbi:hypothetical protein CWE09_04530 [Aliidiomarina minuta]|uniref:Uncharacterized protein n=1 Tax=Aliidiomarina minuta TaxID=880057 RepID=A0A432W7E5_9GAMM|nr:hypothetical protein [Aliidiomarina minuta]RUO25997.1 hypothetical protein CWE09_04530 [Aliidiomarina minuta]